MHILERIISEGFAPDQYIREFTQKNQIVIHHTVSGKGVGGDLNWWLNDPKRIATALLIDRNGVPYQTFSTNYWAYHLGVKRRSDLDKYSIGIELDSWGPLLQTKNGKFYSPKRTKNGLAPNTAMASVDPADVVEIDFRGFHFFEKYTQAQLDTLKELLYYLCNKWGISAAYQADMWDVSDRALAGQNGIFTHVSYRKDKTDCYPYPGLIDTLKSI